MIINIHAGHNPDDMIACGAVGLVRESTEARRIKEKFLTLLSDQPHQVYDCTCNKGSSKQDVLSQIVETCNSHYADLNISLHLNAGANKNADGQTTGVEVYAYSKTSPAYVFAQNICKEIAGLGYKNRGVKVNPNLYVLKYTKAPTVLVECFFCDDPEDVGLYDPERIACAIYTAITGQAYENEKMQDTDRLAAMNQEQFVEYIGQSAREDMLHSGILASVTAAQAILESAYGKSDLARFALNLGGMKAFLSGNTWPSEWDGSMYRKTTMEQNTDGEYRVVEADFRKYPSIRSYLSDHSSYLNNACKGNTLRYKGISGCKDYEKAFQILKNGGYATSLNYVPNLCRVVEKWNLQRFDQPFDDSQPIYVVSVGDVWSQHEAQQILTALRSDYPLLKPVIHKVMVI